MAVIFPNCFILYLKLLQTPERDFTIKFSGLEIYYENVRDLLNLESGSNLKLLDDPEVMASVKLTYFHRNGALC